MLGKLNTEHSSAPKYTEEFNALWDAAMLEVKAVRESDLPAAEQAAKTAAIHKQLGKEIKALQTRYSYLFTEKGIGND